MQNGAVAEGVGALDGPGQWCSSTDCGTDDGKRDIFEFGSLNCTLIRKVRERKRWWSKVILSHILSKRMAKKKYSYILCKK